jgi:cytochrome c-type biogenesis protein CcmH
MRLVMARWLCSFTLTLALLIAGVTSASAVEPGEALSDPALEARARQLSTGLRCLVCQNQSIDDSNAPLAKDLRILVRERLTAGDSDSDIIQYVVARYGDFVLLKPPVNSATLVLWLAPVLLLAGLTFALMRAISFGPASQLPEGTSAPLTKQEEEKLRKLMAPPKTPR